MPYKMEKFLKLTNGNKDKDKNNQQNENDDSTGASDSENSQHSNIKNQSTSGGVKRKRVRVSSVWKYFKRSSDNKLAKCINCGHEYKTSGNTSNLADHLRRHHPLIANSTVNEETATTSNATGSSSLESTSTSSSARSSTRSVSPFFKRAFQYETNSQRKIQIDKAVLEMIALDFQPFTIVKDKGFKRLINLLDPRYVLPSTYTLSGKLLQNSYQEVYQKLKSDLAEIKYVAITSDSWTSCVSESYLTVTCHYINKNFELKSGVLSTKPLANGVNHTAENIAESLANTGKIKSLTADVIITKRQYLERPHSAEDADPLLFWKISANELAPMSECAEKFLCIPATSVESERTFSSTGQVITDRRSKLKPSNVDKLTFLHKNLS